MKIDGELTLSEVYNGIGIQTDQGLFGIAQRDGGIEVMLDGKLAWSSTANDAQRKLERAEAALPWKTRIGRMLDDTAGPQARTASRVETGVVRFADDWPGVFFRGDDALAMAIQIQSVAEDLLAGNRPSALDLKHLALIAEILASCRQGGATEREETQHAKHTHNTHKE